MSESDVPTPYAVICRDHGKVYLTEQGYMDALMKPDSPWLCPICGAPSHWDDENYEEWIDHRSVT